MMRARSVGGLSKESGTRNLIGNLAERQEIEKTRFGG